MKIVLKKILQTTVVFIFMTSVCSKDSRYQIWTNKTREGGEASLIQELNKHIFLFNQLCLLAFTLPMFFSVWITWHYALVCVCNFFSIGLVLFWTQRYMGWFMAAFRPCEWNERRSSKTRGIRCSGKKYWHNQDSKGKCLMNVTDRFSWGSAFIFRE